jgi:PIN domain nuclease of toxin-antitoxin system
MRILLDTQAFLYMAFKSQQGKFPTRAAKELRDQSNEFFVSVATVFEVEILTRKGRINLTQAQIQAGVAISGVTLLPFEPRHAFRTFSLPAHHPDPFDRMIIATALVEDMHLVGGDRQFPKYKGLKLLWD